MHLLGFTLLPSLSEWYRVDFFCNLRYSIIGIQGHVAEWLGMGLQNLLHRFNSGRGLQTKHPSICRGVLLMEFCSIVQKSDLSNISTEVIWL